MFRHFFIIITGPTLRRDVRSDVEWHRPFQMAKTVYEREICGACGRSAPKKQLFFSYLKDNEADHLKGRGGETTASPSSAVRAVLSLQLNPALPPNTSHYV